MIVKESVQWNLKTNSYNVLHEFMFNGHLHHKVNDLGKIDLEAARKLAYENFLEVKQMLEGLGVYQTEFDQNYVDGIYPRTSIIKLGEDHAA